MSFPSAVPARPSLLRRFRVPLLAVAWPIGVLLLLIVWERADLDPAAQMPLFMLFQCSVVLAALIVMIWFLVFSGSSWPVKLATLGVVAALPFLTRIPIRKFEFTGNMRPLIVWRWQSSDAQEALERQRAQAKTAAVLLPEIDLTIGPGDFPRYRGETGDGVVRGVQFTRMPSGEKWRQPCGGGYAGFAVAGNVLVTIEQRRHQEAIVCYDQETGRERWVYAYPAEFVRSEPMGGDGPRATPTLADGDVYSLGATGVLVRLDGKTGTPRWQTNILTDAQAENVSWGMTGSPLIYDEWVIVNPGINPSKNANKAVAAYNRETGQPVWQKGNKPAGYSSPLIAELGGVEQLVLFDGGGLAGINPETGDELWRYGWTTFSDMNIIQPLILDGDRVLISSEGANGCAVVQIARDGDHWSATKVWHHRYLTAKFSNPLAFEGHIYGLSNGTLTCLDARTGERTWRGENYGHGQLLRLGNVLLIQTEFGDLVAVAADPSEPRKLGERKVFEGKTWNTPALARGRLYLRTHQEMVCLELP